MEKPKINYKVLRDCAVKGIPHKFRSIVRQALNNIEINESEWYGTEQNG